MILIYAIMNDNTKTVLAQADNDNFDIQEWANSNKENLKLLGIKEIEYDIYKKEKKNG